MQKKTTLIELIFVEIYRFKGENRRLQGIVEAKREKSAFAFILEPL